MQRETAQRKDFYTRNVISTSQTFELQEVYPSSSLYCTGFWPWPKYRCAFFTLQGLLLNLGHAASAICLTSSLHCSVHFESGMKSTQWHWFSISSCFSFSFSKVNLVSFCSQARGVFLQDYKLQLFSDNGFFASTSLPPLSPITHIWQVIVSSPNRVNVKMQR